MTDHKVPSITCIPHDMSPENKAAWLVAPCADPLEVKPAPYTPPLPNEMVVKNGAVSINALDWAKQFCGDKKWKYLPHPFILGADIAGEVVEVGSEVTRFKVGDRVVAHTLAFYDYGHGCKPSEGAFQLYVIAREHMASPIPDSMSFEQASVLPLSCSAAASALFMKGDRALGLEYPTVPAAPPNGQVVIITGGATSVSSNAIQLARFAGYEVVTTCSPYNNEYVKRLGASLVFDYNSPTIETDMVNALKGKKVAGAFAVGTGSTEVCMRVLGQLGGDCRKMVVKASFPWPRTLPSNDEKFDKYLKWVDEWNVSIEALEKETGVTTGYLEGAELARNEVAKVLYEDFLPKALGDGGFIAAPEAHIIGEGLQLIQEGMNIRKAGVKTKKIVVSLKS